jgi:hypothetical protein
MTPEQARYRLEAMQFVQSVLDEVDTARACYPDKPTMAVLVEEVGEVARALQDEGRQALYSECIQVAAMALRLALEGAREYQRSWPEGETR